MNEKKNKLKDLYILKRNLMGAATRGSKYEMQSYKNVCESIKSLEKEIKEETLNLALQA